VPSPLPPAPAPVCRVPRVVGKTLTAARVALAKAHCAAGTVKKTYSTKVAKNRVITQAPKAGTSRAVGARVNLTVSRGRKATKK
jgi:beta-lactam-binding protein with PASTA domain